MTITQRISLLFAALALAALASCGSSVTTPGADTSGSLTLHDWAASQTWPSSFSTDSTGMPAFPQEGGQRSASVGGGSQTVGGAAFIQKRYAEVDGDALVIGPSPGGEGQNTAYGMYKFTGLNDMRLDHLTVNALPQELEMRYFVALADFTNTRWHWWGPVTLPEFNLNFENQSARFISPLGNVYMVVATHESHVATHSHSVLSYSEGGGGIDDPVPPGAPTGLIASDGTFANAIGLTWQPGEAAQWYRIFRKNLEPNGTNDWIVIGESQTTEYMDHGRAPGVVHHYKVQSARLLHDGTILHSGFSNIDSGFATEQGGLENYIIQGVITDGYRAGTTVTLLGKGEEPIMQQLGAGGTFRFDGLHSGIYIVYPYNPNHQFLDEFWCDDIGPNNPEVNLTFEGGPVVNGHRAWGFIYTFGGNPGAVSFQPLPGIQVQVHKDGTQDFFTGESGECGFYEVFENQVGLNIVKPINEAYEFQPVQSTVEISGDHLPAPRIFRAFAR